MSIFEIVGIGVGLYASFYLIKAIRSVFNITRELKQIEVELKSYEKK